jgi:hypothetical protein
MTLQELRNQLKETLRKLNMDAGHVDMNLVHRIAEELDTDWPHWQKQECLSGEQLSYVFNSLISF